MDKTRRRIRLPLFPFAVFRTYTSDEIGYASYRRISIGFQRYVNIEITKITLASPTLDRQSHRNNTLLMMLMFCKANNHSIQLYITVNYVVFP